MLKRKRALTDREISDLERIHQSPVDDLVCCAVDILLENKYSARRKIDNMSFEDQETFKDFPIYNLL